MKSRPQIVLLLVLLLVIEPIIKILLFKASFGFEWNIIFKNIASMSGAANIFNFWFLFPLSGIAIYIYRKWSYALFLVLQLYSLYVHLTYESYTWPYISKQPTIHSYIMVAISIFLAIYFVMPKVRKPYFLKNMRWWEQAPRYKTALNCLVHFHGDNVYETRILNISRSGCFVEGLKDLDLSSVVNISIPTLDENLMIPSLVVSQHQYSGVDGAGMRFLFKEQSDERKIKDLMRKVRVETQQVR